MSEQVGYHIPEQIVALLAQAPIPQSHMLQTHPLRKVPVGQIRPDSIVVELSHQEYLDMSLLGLARSLASGGDLDRLSRMVMGEASLSKSLGHAIDLQPSKWNVRRASGLFTAKSSPLDVSFHSGLGLRKSDDDSLNYVLVIGVGSVYEIAGWLRGSEVKTNEHFNEQGGFWMAPAESLHPIRSLPGAGTFSHQVTSAEIFSLCKTPSSRAETVQEQEFDRLFKEKDVNALWAEAKFFHSSIK